MSAIALVVQITKVNKTMTWLALAQTQPSNFDPLWFQPSRIGGDCARGCE